MLKGTRSLIAEYLRQRPWTLLGGIYLVGAVGLKLGFSIGLFPPCLWHSLFGVHCPGCGLTTALLGLFRLDLEGAWRAGPLIFLLVPGALIYGFLDWRSFRRRRFAQ